MKHNSETIKDDSGIELIIGYVYEEDKSYYAEPNNQSTFVPATMEIEILFVHQYVLGNYIEISKLLNDHQINIIISKLTYE